MTVNNKDEQGKKESEIQRTCLINIDNIDSCRWVAGHESQLRCVEEKRGKWEAWSCEMNVSVCVYILCSYINVCACVFARVYLSERQAHERVLRVRHHRDKRWTEPARIPRYLTNRKWSSPERRGTASSALRNRARRKFKSTAPSPAELEQRLAFIAIIRGHGNGGKCNEMFRQIQFLLEPRRYPYPIGPL